MPVYPTLHPCLLGILGNWFFFCFFCFVSWGYGWFRHLFLLVAFFSVINQMVLMLLSTFFSHQRTASHSATDLRFNGAGKGPTSTVELDLVFYKESPLFSAIRLFLLVCFSLFPSSCLVGSIASTFQIFLTPGSVSCRSVIFHINSELGIGEESLDDLNPTCFCLNDQLLCGLHCLIGLCSDPAWLLPSCFVIPGSVCL